MGPGKPRPIFRGKREPDELFLPAQKEIKTVQQRLLANAQPEMRQRIVERLKEASRLSQLSMAKWRELRERMGDIQISTIDAFCLRLLREFPLEADVDPGFSVADDTELPRLVDEALDRALRKALGAFYPQLDAVHLVDYKVRILDGTSATGAKTRVVIDSVADVDANLYYGSSVYGSRYQGQRGPTPSRSFANFHRTHIEG